MTIPVRVKLRKARALRKLSGCVCRSAICDGKCTEASQFDLSHVVISLHTGFKELQGRILSLDESSPGIVNFWGSVAPDHRNKLLCVQDSAVLTEIDRLFNGRVKISGIPKQTDVAQAASAFSKAMEMDGILRIPNNATLAFVGALKAIENAVGTALVKQLFLRKFSVCLAFIIARSWMGWTAAAIYLLLAMVNSRPRNAFIQFMYWLTDLIFVSKHDLLQDVSWKIESFLTGMLLLHAIDSVRAYTLVVVSLVFPLFLGMLKKVTVSSADVTALDAVKKFILLANQLLLLWFSCTSYGRVLFIVCMFYAQFGWYAFRTGVAITRLPARAIGLMLWYLLSVHDRTRLTQWYSVRQNRLTVLALSACLVAFLVYKTWNLTPGLCTVTHFSMFYAFIHLLPAEQLLTLILYTMTLPVYLSNMPVDTLARELREWGKEMVLDEKEDDRWLEVLCANINKTTSDAIRRRFRRHKEPDPIRTQRIQVAEASSSSNAPHNVTDSKFDFGSAGAPANRDLSHSHSYPRSLDGASSYASTTRRLAADTASDETVMGRLKHETAVAGIRSIRISNAACM